MMSGGYKRTKEFYIIKELRIKQFRCYGIRDLPIGLWVYKSHPTITQGFTNNSM